MKKSSIKNSTTPLTKMLLSLGVIAPVLFVAVFLIDGATRPNYDAVYHSVSSLSLGSRGWLQITNFIITGLLFIGFAVGIRKALKSGPAALWGPLLFAIFGIGLIFSGVFVMDPMQGYPAGAPTGVVTEDASWHHSLHDIFGLVVFGSLPLIAFVFSRRFLRYEKSNAWFAYSLLTGIAGIVLFLTYGTAWEADASYAGLVQRITLIVGLGWIAFLAGHYKKQA